MYYKYRNLDNFKNFVDIILNNRLYAATYTSMNDPMEGYFRYTTGELTKEVLKNIKGEKERQYICSLSKRNNIELMWAHYCDGNRGLVIGVEVPNTEYRIEPINYSGLLDITKYNENINMNYEELSRKILTHKHKFWEYEEEVRIFVKNHIYIDVNVKEIILGSKMDNQTKSFIRKLVEQINPNIEIKNSEVSLLDDE